MKECRGCGLDLPLGSFYRHPRMADGCLNYCKDCVRSRVNKGRVDNIDEHRERDRARGFRPGDPVKRKARRKLYYHAVETGRIPRQPCAVCGEKVVEGHHPDYSKPLEVSWLCHAHHGEVHRT